MKNTARTIILSILALVLAVSGCAMAETVYVSIASDGVQLAYLPVEMSDTDGDGMLTVSDALYLAHEAAYPGGAAEGYEAVDSDYGLSLSKLWGVENGGSYGYYVNNVASLSLSDSMADGDMINAYCYQDLTSWTDTYCFFDCGILTGEAGEAELTLTAYGFDADWNPLTYPLEGAIITVDGEDTELVTDAEGKVRFSVDASCVISARSDSMILVPPVCRVEIG